MDEIEKFLCKQENLHNPFLENSSPRISFLDVAVDILMTITSRRNSRKCSLSSIDTCYFISSQHVLHMLSFNILFLVLKHFQTSFN